MSDNNQNATLNEDLVSQLAEYFVKGATLKDVKGIDDAQMETLYALGFNLYKAGKAEDAEKVFSLLTLLDYGVEKYWLGLGAAQQAQRKFDKAVHAYAMATMIDASDPRAQYHAAECFLAVGDKENAESALLAVETFAPEKSEYREKAAILKKAL